MGCLEPDVGPAIVEPCETVLFGNPAALGLAHTYSAERLAFVADALKVKEPRSPTLEASVRHIQRALEQDRFGLVAYLLSAQRGCNQDHCDAFALLRDVGQLRRNLERESILRRSSRATSLRNQSSPLLSRSGRAFLQLS